MGLIRAGVPVIIGTGAVDDTASAIARAAHVQTVGAQGLMVIPRGSFSRLDHFRADARQWALELKPALAVLSSFNELSPSQRGYV